MKLKFVMSNNLRKILLVFISWCFLSACGNSLPRKPEHRQAIYVYCYEYANRFSPDYANDAYKRCEKLKSAEYIQLEIREQELIKEERVRLEALEFDKGVDDVCILRGFAKSESIFKICKMQVINEIEEKKRLALIEKRLKSRLDDLESEASWREFNELWKKK